MGCAKFAAHPRHLLTCAMRVRDNHESRGVKRERWGRPMARFPQIAKLMPHLQRADIWGSMKVPTSDRKSIRHQNKYRSRRHEQRDSWTRKRAVGASSKIIIIVEGDWKTFRRYQPKWDARLYHYMYRYFDNKGSV